MNNNNKFLYIFLILISLLIVVDAILFYNILGKVVLFLLSGLIIFLIIIYIAIKLLTLPRHSRHPLVANERYQSRDNLNSDNEVMDRHIRQTLLQSNFITHKIIIIVEVSIIFILLIILIIRLKLLGG